jgi:hypothetical protein
VVSWYAKKLILDICDLLSPSAASTAPSSSVRDMTGTSFPST